MPGDDVCVGAGYQQAFLVKVGAVDKDLVVNTIGVSRRGHLITKDINPVITENSPESRTFYDVVYWIVQHIEPQHDPKTFANGGREGQTLTFPELIGNSFTVPGQKYELGYTLASLIMWWDRRVKEGVLKETDNSFILDEDYAGSVFDQLRRGKIQN